jgi:hypothetical protein
MPRRKSLDEPSPPPPASIVRRLVRRWLVQIAVLLLFVGLALVGVIWLGSYAREQLREHERFQVYFGDIDCNPPPPLKRPEFLDEVQYLSQLPERFSIFEEGLSDRLREGFTKHPWVAKVARVEVSPPREVRVTLEYRQAALAVVVTPDLAGEGVDGSAEKPSLRAVDERGVLLPKKVPLAADLPVLYRAPRPAGGAGQPWGDPGVAAVARAAVLLKQQLARGKIKALTWADDGLTLWGPGYRVLWGRLEPSKSAEAASAVKEQRLAEVLAKGEPWTWWPWMHEYDLRPREATVERLVAWEKP